jgi:hypothetical protein
MHPPRDVTKCPRSSGRWSPDQIRTARMVELAPLLTRRGLTLYDRNGGNWEVMQYHGLLLKASYWRWPDRNLAGNTIDFYTKVLGASFNDAMQEITDQP